MVSCGGRCWRVAEFSSPKALICFSQWLLVILLDSQPERWGRVQFLVEDAAALRVRAGFRWRVFPVFRKWRFCTLELQAEGRICFAKSSVSWDTCLSGCGRWGAGGLWGWSRAGSRTLAPWLVLGTLVLPWHKSVSRWVDRVQVFASWLLALQEQTIFLMDNKLPSIPSPAEICFLFFVPWQHRCAIQSECVNAGRDKSERLDWQFLNSRWPFSNYLSAWIGNKSPDRLTSFRLHCFQQK